MDASARMRCAARCSVGWSPLDMTTVGISRGGLTVAIKGASLDDPHGLFNAGLDAKATRGIDIREGDAINEPALQDLVRAAVALNAAGGRKK